MPSLKWTKSILTLNYAQFVASKTNYWLPSKNLSLKLICTSCWCSLVILMLYPPLSLLLASALSLTHSLSLSFLFYLGFQCVTKCVFVCARVIETQNANYSHSWSGVRSQFFRLNHNILPQLASYTVCAFYLRVFFVCFVNIAVVVSYSRFIPLKHLLNYETGRMQCHELN